MTHLTVLTNPTAGHAAAQAAEAAIAHLRARGLTVTHHAATSAAESHELAQEAARTGARGIVAAGGDGLVSIALQAVAATPVALGVIPIGTGNDCARMLDIPLSDPVAAAEVIAAGRTRVIDAGRIQYHGDTTWFATVVASGFDSLVNDRANRMRWPRGRRRYDIAMALEAAKLRPLPFRIELDDQVIDTDVTLVAVGNGTSYGGGMRIPASSPHSRCGVAACWICATPTSPPTRLRSGPSPSWADRRFSCRPRSTSMSGAWPSWVASITRRAAMVYKAPRT